MTSTSRPVWRRPAGHGPVLRVLAVPAGGPAMRGLGPEGAPPGVAQPRLLRI
ncbi:hypothetical protein J7F03_30750 [Streptomyces sp. ISL-43]|uniref:hypothetical protein n=1 Tax=Streptomyces sp. ISL-43 TaxID=2819183 RepID=UPI001BE88E3F|nr:hypothetical protein [Streptomyces sp. ISL-43]MBT2451372.1 hypothetical protein [Streptomyces sp. ISL-43]